MVGKYISLVRICLQTRNDAQSAEMHLQNFATSHPNHAAGVYEIEAKPCMELRRSRVWNHHEVMYGINPKAEKREYALKRDAMPS